MTAFANSTGNTDDILKMVGGAPVVIKLLEGTQGIGVVLGETHKSAKSVIEAFHGANINILVQEFIKEAEGHDIRAFVVGARSWRPWSGPGRMANFGPTCIAAAQPTCRTDGGGKISALKAAKAMGLNVAGVDMLRSKRGPVVMEVNSSPGLEGIEGATGKDVAKAIIEYLERTPSPGKTKTRGKG